MTSAAMRKADLGSENPVARPLKVLVPLIKEDVEQGNEAAKQAGTPHYRAAGEKMLEAKAQIKHGEFQDWIKRTFGLGKSQSNYYMSLARTTVDWQKSSAEDFSSLKDFRRRGLGEAGDLAEKARADRLNEDRKTAEQEHESELGLRRRLIKLGYNALAKELHPDKGGSDDAMARLGRVRDQIARGGGTAINHTRELERENARLRRENIELRSGARLGWR